MRSYSLCEWFVIGGIASKSGCEAARANALTSWRGSIYSNPQAPHRANAVLLARICVLCEMWYGSAPSVEPFSLQMCHTHTRTHTLTTRYEHRTAAAAAAAIFGKKVSLHSPHCCRYFYMCLAGLLENTAPKTHAVAYGLSENHGVNKKKKQKANAASVLSQYFIHSMCFCFLLHSFSWSELWIFSTVLWNTTGDKLIYIYIYIPHSPTILLIRPFVTLSAPRE